MPPQIGAVAVRRLSRPPRHPEGVLRSGGLAHCIAPQDSRGRVADRCGPSSSALPIGTLREGCLTSTGDLARRIAPHPNKRTGEMAWYYLRQMHTVDPEFAGPLVRATALAGKDILDPRVVQKIGGYLEV